MQTSHDNLVRTSRVIWCGTDGTLVGAFSSQFCRIRKVSRNVQYVWHGTL